MYLYHLVTVFPTVCKVLEIIVRRLERNHYRKNQLQGKLCLVDLAGLFCRLNKELEVQRIVMLLMLFL